MPGLPDKEGDEFDKDGGPDEQNDGSGLPVFIEAEGLPDSPGGGLMPDLGRDAFQAQGDKAGQDEEVVQIPQEGNEIGDEIDGTEGIGHGQGDEDFRTPGQIRMAGGIIKEGQPFLELSRPAAE